MSGETCGSCIHKGGGDCRRFPPQVIVWQPFINALGQEEDPDVDWRYPQVTDDKPACGEFAGDEDWQPA